MMANSFFTEPIEICFRPMVGDGAGGLKPLGPETVVDSFVATVQEKSANRTDQSGKLVFQNVYLIELWINPAYTLSNKHYVKWRGKKLIIQDIKSDTRLLKNYLTLIADGI